MSKKGSKRPITVLLLELASKAFERVTTGDCTRQNSYSACDCLMSGLEIFFFKLPSMLQFDVLNHEEPTLRANLRVLFGIEQVPSDSTLRRRHDAVDPKHVHRVLRTTIGWLRRHRMLEPFRATALGDRVPLLIDGTHYFTPTKVHCNHCLERKPRNGEIGYNHAGLGAVVAHPDVPQVLPVAAEAIVRVDGATKQDCELNAFQRLLSRLVRTGDEG